MKFAHPYKQGRGVIRPAERSLLFVLILLSGAPPAMAWGDLGHQRVNAAAIAALPEPMRSYFRARQSYFLEHATEPDTVARQDPAERPHHYTEIEAYDRFPFREFERRFVAEHWNPPPAELASGEKPQTSFKPINMRA